MNMNRISLFTDNYPDSPLEPSTSTHRGNQERRSEINFFIQDFSLELRSNNLPNDNLILL